MPIISGGGSGGGGGAISGVTITGTAAAGQVPVASSSSAGAWALPPGFEFGYDQITVGVTVSSTTEATPTTIIACAAHTFDGGAVLMHFYTPNVVSGGNMTMNLFEGATNLGRVGTDGLGGVFTPVTTFFRFTPSVGSHTYTFAGWMGSATATIGAGAGGSGNNVPAFVRFTKV